VAERIIPPPTSVSSQAREILAASSRGAAAAYPAAEDIASWKALVEAGNKGMSAMIFSAAHDAACQVEATYLGGVPSHRATPRNAENGT
jgi:epsilon-lactone hydrolase